MQRRPNTPLSRGRNLPLLWRGNWHGGCYNSDAGLGCPDPPRGVPRQFLAGMRCGGILNQPAQSDAAQAAVSLLPSVLSVWQVLSWIAVRELRCVPTFGTPWILL